MTWLEGHDSLVAEKGCSLKTPIDVLFFSPSLPEWCLMSGGKKKKKKKKPMSLNGKKIRKA